MDLFMRGIHDGASSDLLDRELAKILHSPPYSRFSDGGIPLNFRVFLFRNKKRQDTKAGIVTVPFEEVGEQFLREYGGRFPQRRFSVLGKPVVFQQSDRPVRTENVEYCRLMPYQDPQARAERDRRTAELNEQVQVQMIQFGWVGRDAAVFSVEWTKTDDFLSPPTTDGAPAQHYLVRYVHIKAIYVVDAGEQSIYLTLSVPPSFEQDITAADDLEKYRALRLWESGEAQCGLFDLFDLPKPQGIRRRVSHFGGEHERVAPFVSLEMRLILPSADDMSRFRHLAGVAGVPFMNDYEFTVERRNLFSEPVLDELAQWLRKVPWMVAFHLEVLHRKLLLTPAELLALRQDVDRIWKRRGVRYTSQLIRHFAGDPVYNLTEPGVDAVQRAFRKVARKFDPKSPSWITEVADGLFDCLHIAVTPSSIVPREQYPDRSNRVIRSYPNNQQHFVRVEFCEEDYLRYRWPDRDVDGEEFVRTRVGGILRRGIKIGGRSFEFLAYSQSALKDHAVWFVRPFKKDGVMVTAEVIRKSLGSFDKVIYYPSLYGARMSQAFTATDPSVTITAEDLLRIPDVEGYDEDGKLWQFTDGVGTVSPALADDIARALRARQRRKRAYYVKPRAFQIRFGGSKGMVSVDITLPGRILCLRPSQIKFEAPESLDIEIAKIFDKPGKFLLNRPMIMVLESLGVPADAFMKLQDDAVRDAEAARTSFSKAAHMIDTHGLGTSFRVSSVLLGLRKLGLDFENLGDDYGKFVRRMMTYAVNHVLRELKHHARIPVPDSWTLVGIADIHGVLAEGEVFACIDLPQGEGRMFLEGRVIVTRSPVAHPGDIRILKAIGRPPPGSPYALDPIPNTVIFSLEGSRPIASCLGGGDLDGDVFNVSQCRELFPRLRARPASYDAAERKKLDRPSRIEDVMDFVVDFINNDNLGMIANTWLIIADQSPTGVFHESCLLLSKLHSDAVDFQKSGRPVPRAYIPRLLHRAKPDWNAPETIRPNDDRYYKSTKAIGYLFRAVELPALDDAQEQARTQRGHMAQRQQRREPTLEEAFKDLDLEPDTYNDPITIALHAKLLDWIDMDDDDEEPMLEAVAELFERYSTELYHICSNHTLSQSRRPTPLTEEEAFVGTIVAKTSQARQRKNLMSKMRDASALLVTGIRSDLSGDDTTPFEDWLKKAWLAWRYSVTQAEKEIFGARSFGFIAIGSILDGIRSIEDQLRGRNY